MFINVEDLIQKCKEENCNIQGYEELLETVVSRCKTRDIEEAYQIFLSSKKEQLAKEIIPLMPSTLIENLSGEALWDEALYFKFKHPELFKTKED